MGGVEWCRTRGDVRWRQFSKDPVRCAADPTPGVPLRLPIPHRRCRCLQRYHGLLQRFALIEHRWSTQAALDCQKLARPSATLPAPPPAISRLAPSTKRHEPAPSPTVVTDELSLLSRTRPENDGDSVRRLCQKGAPTNTCSTPFQDLASFVFLVDSKCSSFPQNARTTDTPYTYPHPFLLFY